MKVDDMPGPRYLGAVALKDAASEQIRVFEAVFYRELGKIQHREVYPPEDRETHPEG